MAIGIGSAWFESGVSFIEPAYKKVKAVQDDSGHWYLIPNELVDTFYGDDVMEIDNFDDKYSRYKTGGDLNLVQLYIKE
jgi:hypothetical protein